MKTRFVIRAFILLFPILSACNLQKAGSIDGTNPDIVATAVVLTMAAYTQSAQLTPLASQTLVQPTITKPITLSPTSTPTDALTATMTQTQALTNTPIPSPGTIAGDISGYPYGSLPKLAIVAFDQERPATYSYWITAAGNASYSMTSSYLLPGKYQVVAYDSSGHTGGCPSIVTVVSDQTVTCNISHWGGGYPARPSGVPNP
jgi:hypothetical protein